MPNDGNQHPTPVDDQFTDLDDELVDEQDEQLETESEDDEEFEKTDEYKEQDGNRHPQFQKRIDKLTAARRAAEERAAEHESTLDAMRRHNEQLMQIIGGQQQAFFEPEESPDKALDNKIAELETQLQEHLDSLSYADAFKVQREIGKLEVQKAQIANKPKEDAQLPVDPNMIAAQVATEEFISDNPWYNEDAERRAYADSYDRTLAANPKWANNYRGRLREVARKVNELTEKGAFNAKPTRRNYPSLTAGAGDFSSPSDSGIELTPDEESVAVKMFSNLSPSEAKKVYLKQKIIINKGGR